MMPMLLQVQRPTGFTIPALDFTLVSIGILLALLLNFTAQWRRSKAAFTLGLMAFTAILLLSELVRVARAAGLRAPSIDAVPEFLEMVALFVLLYLGTR